MSSQTKIMVTGATGAQGGSVARALLADGHFAVRALSRNPDSDKAAALRAAGAEVVRGDLADSASVKKALEGCTACFGVTNFWEHFDAEFEQGKNLIEAVAAAGIKDFILSTLPPVKNATDGELSVPHFDTKAELETLTRRLIPGAVEDLGGVVAPVFHDLDSWRGKVIGVVGDDRPATDYAAVLSRVTGVTIRYNHIPREVFAGFGFPGADDLANMFDFNRRFIPNRQDDLAMSKKLYPAIRNFDSWAEQNKTTLTALVTG